MEKPLQRKTGLEWVVEGLGAVLLLVVTLVTLGQVFFRYVLKIPFIWSEEFVRLLFIWIVWLGAALAIPQGKHMVIETIRERFPPGWKRGVTVAMNLLALAFLALVVVKGAAVFKAMANDYYVTFPLSVKYAYLAAVVGGGLMFYFLVVQTIETVRSAKGGSEQ